MKRMLCLFSAVWLMLLAVSGCAAPVAYRLDDFIPPLMDAETQYPYVTEIVVTEIATGEVRTFTEGVDHNQIRMYFEELECLRTKVSPSVTVGYTVAFVTTSETVTLTIPTEEGEYLSRYVYIGEYEFEILRQGVDTAYFGSLFAE